MPFTLRRTVDATVEPILYDEAKLHCREDFDFSQATIEALIVAARNTVEEATQRQLITATWELSFDCFPCIIELPRPPIAAVSSIAYIDENGDSQTLSSALYQVDAKSQPGRVVPAVDEVWPDTESQTLNAVTVTYTAGYGASGASVPRALRQAMLLLISHWNEHREAVAFSSATELPLAVKMLIAPYRTMVQR